MNKRIKPMDSLSLCGIICEKVRKAAAFLFTVFFSENSFEIKLFKFLFYIIIRLIVMLR